MNDLQWSDGCLHFFMKCAASAAVTLRQRSAVKLLLLQCMIQQRGCTQPLLTILTMVIGTEDAVYRIVKCTDFKQARARLGVLCVGGMAVKADIHNVRDGDM